MCLCSVMVDASSYNFLFYEGGVFSDVNCGSDETNLSHAMLLVGYVDYEESGSSYWILKNRYIHAVERKKPNPISYI